MNDNMKIAVAASVGAAAGFATGYFLAKKQLEAKYKAMADEEIASVKKTYSVVVNNAKPMSPSEMAAKVAEEVDEEAKVPQEALEALRSYSGQPIQSDEEKAAVLASLDEAEHELEVHNVFEDNEVRDRDKPYIVSTEEFMNDKEDWDKITLTYYEEDDSLCDEQDQLVPDIETTVGQANMTKFGMGDDPNTLYIRNEAIESDFEVLLDKGSYSKAVLGLGEEFLEHSDWPRSRKPRRDEWDSR